ncbi:MAG: hypothetical protein WC648_03215 [Candidatus Paceibacterota bacterium]|jgi:hypothetical protein
MKRTLKVETCPDKLKLAFCLFEGDNKTQEPIAFKVRETDGTQEWTEYVKVNSVQREDGSGNNFNIKGYNTANSCFVNIFISTTWRSGTMTFD